MTSEACESIQLTVNGEAVEVTAPSSRSLLDVLREDLDLTGAKQACDNGECGSCIVLLGRKPAKACLLAAKRAAGKELTTIEGLAPSDEELHPLQREWITLDVPQCGYCQAGQIMSAAALLHRTSSPSDAEIDAAMQGNLCRCGAYVNIVRAIGEIADNQAVGR